MSHIAEVRKAYPQAYASQTKWLGGEQWTILATRPTGRAYLGDDEPGALGEGATEMEAWLDAFKNLPGRQD